MVKNSLKVRHDDAISELENYKLLVESIQDYAIFLMDSKGYIKTWNKGAEKFKGYKASEIIGKHFSTFYRQVDLDSKKPEKELEVAIKFGRVEDEDWRVRKDGSLFWASVIITTLYDKDNNHIGFAKVTRDLTERKKFEDELREANIQLKRQQAELLITNDAKDEFISLASHQLRTPATVVKQLLGMYAEGIITDLPQKHLSLINKAYDSNQRLIDIINSLLKVAQVDSGKLILVFSECNINKLLNECIDEFKETAKNKKQDLSLIYNSKFDTIEADEKNLRMAIENIISNAVKYTHPGGSIEVMASSTKNSLIIEISDNGVGIPSSELNNLFKKFKRIQNDLSDVEGGTGLGLYWAQRIINLHGGTIEVKSTLHEGTTFKLKLPKKVKNA